MFERMVPMIKRVDELSYAERTEFAHLSYGFSTMVCKNMVDFTYKDLDRLITYVYKIGQALNTYVPERSLTDSVDKRTADVSWMAARQGMKDLHKALSFTPFD